MNTPAPSKGVVLFFRIMSYNKKVFPSPLDITKDPYIPVDKFDSEIISVNVIESVD